MLKTPKCPVWITLINGQIGLLFSINIDLVSDWRIENRFLLYYYTGLPNHPKCCLNIGKCTIILYYLVTLNVASV